VSGRNLADQSFAHSAAATQTREVGLGAGFIEKNQSIGVDLSYLLFPPRPRFGNVGAILLGGVEGLFLKDNPSFLSQRSTVDSDTSKPRRSLISMSVASG
jgi:hypothetical protein